MRRATPAGLVAACVALMGCSDDAPSSRDIGAVDTTSDVLRPDGPSHSDLSGPVDLDPPTDLPPGPFVQILQPKDGATVKNPVTFVVAANNVATVRLYADAWPLGPAWDPKVKTQHTYTFNGLDYQRHVELFGYDATGKQVAADSIHITVSSASSLDKGQLVGTMWITYYYLAKETDYSGAADTTLYDSSCKAITKVSAAFSDSVCIEGSGLLADGRVINYAKTCSCGRPCPTGGTVCYSVLDKTKFPWGMGAASNALLPLRSFAVDKSLIPIGTILYAQEWDGVSIPKVDGLGGFIHDGCFRADDVGGAINGLHYDFFAGTKTMWQSLEQIHKTKANFTVYKNGGRCAHLTP